MYLRKMYLVPDTDKREQMTLCDHGFGIVLFKYNPVKFSIRRITQYPFHRKSQTGVVPYNIQYIYIAFSVYCNFISLPKAVCFMIVPG